MDLGKKRKDYRYEIKHSLQIKEGETVEEILESTPTNHGPWAPSWNFGSNGSEMEKWNW
jgi:hypothetical protein